MSFSKFSLFEILSKAKRKYYFPTFSQWTKLGKILSVKEQKTLLLISLLFLSSLTFLISFAYTNATTLVPATGGTLIEGMIGSPRFLNPVYDQVNDADRALSELLFSGILRYNNQGILVPDLAENLNIIEGGRIYEVDIKEGIRWHDGYELNADDILFTIQTIQDPRYKSPIRANWVGVNVQKISSFKIRFVLKDPFASFPERLTLKILPKHLWEEISPENFALSSLNLQPIGTGPYRLVDIKQTKSGTVKEIQLRSHTKYHLEGPYIKKLIFKFFETEQDLLHEADEGKLQSFSLTNLIPQRFRNPALKTYEFSLPRSYSLFFNIKANSPIKEENVRKALAFGIDQNELNKEAFGGKAIVLSSLLRADLFGFTNPPIQNKDITQALSLLKKEGYEQVESGNLVKAVVSSDFSKDLRQGNQGNDVIALQECLATDSQVYPNGTINGVFGPATKKAVIAFQEKYAEDVLLPSGLKKGTGTVGPSTRAKLKEVCSTPQGDTPLELTLTTLDQSPLKDAASFVVDSWKELGINTKLNLVSSSELERDVLKPRNFEILLFGEVMGKTPDPLPFWHSSQTKDPGLNLSGYENKEADELLEQIRRTSDKEIRNEFLEELQDILLSDLPAVALWDIPFQYVASKEIQGITEQLLSEPGQRFSGALDWYIKTKRVWSF